MRRVIVLLFFLLSGMLSLVAQEYNDENIIRLAKITVDPLQLEEYNNYLKEEIEASLAIEPGVIMLYALAEKENPNRITILEIYANQQAYLDHIQTPHFIKYKEGTAQMVQSLELIDTVPLLPLLGREER